MVVETNLVNDTLKLSAKKENGFSVSAELLDVSPAVRSELTAGVRIAATLLCCCLVVGAVQQPRMEVATELILPIYRSQITSNFITLDDCYVMTADGKIFFVQED